jgi:hypothetical protein
MQVDEVRLVYRGDACFQDIVADKFTDRGCRGRVDRWSEGFENRSDNAGDDTATASVTHTDGVCAEQEDRLENLRGGEDEMPDGVRGCRLTVRIIWFGDVVWV